MSSSKWEPTSISKPSRASTGSSARGRRSTTTTTKRAASSESAAPPAKEKRAASPRRREPGNEGTGGGQVPRIQVDPRHHQAQQLPRTDPRKPSTEGVSVVGNETTSRSPSRWEGGATLLPRHQKGSCGCGTLGILRLGRRSTHKHELELNL